MAETRNYYTSLFNELVGDHEAAVQLTQDMSASVKASAEAGAEPAELYTALRDSARLVITSTLKEMVPARSSGISKIIGGSRELSRMATVGCMGSDAVVAALRGAGNCFEDFAEVPQDIATVQKGAYLALGTAYSLAYMNNEAASLNLGAHLFGVDPYKWRNTFTVYLGAHVVSTGQQFKCFNRSFEVEEDERGQLTLLPSFKHIEPSADSYCPATKTKVHNEHGEFPALWNFTRAIGNVAVTEIYPRQFDIAQPTSPIPD